MPDRFPVGLIFGAFICVAVAIGMFTSARNDSSGQRGRSRGAIVAGLALMCTALLLLLGAVNTQWLFRFGPPLAIGIVIIAGIMTALNYWSRRDP